MSDSGPGLLAEAADAVEREHFDKSEKNFVNLSCVERELMEFDYHDSWNVVFHRMKNEASLASDNVSVSSARLVENRALNRYRDVSPYDHSRVLLRRIDNNYINASVVDVSETQRSYILTQAPLANTAGHFWLMVWEQNSRVIVMLNRVIEKGAIKCHPYFPTGSNAGTQSGSVSAAAVDSMNFEDVKLRVCLLNQRHHGYFIEREFLLEDVSSDGLTPQDSEAHTDRTKIVKHFHYLTWPDFGVPKSPGSFLNFLLALRKSGSFEVSEDQSASGRPVVHCSAGIGRAGTLALVDTCLLLIQKQKDMGAVDLRKILVQLRQYRMGLIQTADQLRFSYNAVVEGGRALLSGNEEVQFPVDPNEDMSSSSSESDDGDDEVIILGDSDLDTDNKVNESSQAMPSEDSSTDSAEDSSWYANMHGESSTEPYFVSFNEDTQLVTPNNSCDEEDELVAATTGDGSNETRLRRRAKEDRFAHSQALIERMRRQMRALNIERARNKYFRYAAFGLGAVLMVAGLVYWISGSKRRASAVGQMLKSQA